MAYIGKTPVIGNFVKLDAITVVNGQAAYTMQNGGVNFTSYDNVNQFLVSLNGVLQAPTNSFTVSGSTLTFASNLSTGDSIDFVLVLGNSLDIGTPSDNTVSLAKLTATGTKNSTTFLRGDNTFAAPSGGKVLQVVSTTKDDAFNTSSTSLTDITGLTLNITPAASSSKILIFGNISSSYRNYISTFQLVRGSTNIAIGGSSDTFRGTTSRYAEGVTNSLSMTNHSFHFLDSPSTSSQTTYKIQVKVNGGSVYINDRSNGDSSFISTITAMEIGA